MNYMDASGAPKNFLDSIATVPSHLNAENSYRALPPPPLQSFHASAVALPSHSQSASHINNGANDHSSIASFPGDFHRRDQCLPCPQFTNSSNNLFPKELMYQSSFNQSRPSEEASMSNIIFEKPKRIRKSRVGPKQRQDFSDTLKFAADVDLTEYESFQQQSIFTPASATSGKPKRRRASSKAESNGGDPVPDITEKPHVPKRPMSKGKVDDNPSSSMSNAPVSSNKVIQDDTNSLKGILGSYGMDPKTLDFIQYMKDAPFEGLMSSNFNLSGYIPKQEPSPSTSSFGLNVQNGSNRSSNAEPVKKPSVVTTVKCDRIPNNFMLDIQSSQGEIQCAVAGDKPIHVPAMNPSPMQTYPVIQTTENWQLPANQSLVSLLTQSGTVDHRISPNEMNSSWSNKANNISQSLPFHPSPAQLGGPDKSKDSLMANWFQSGTVNCTQSETSSTHTAQNPRLDKFPFKLDFDNSKSSQPKEKPIKKEFVLDIDLNDPSPEAEAEAIESVGHSSGVFSSNSDSAHKMSPAPQVGDIASDGAQMRDEASDGVSHAKSDTQQPLVLSNPSSVAEASCTSIEQTMSGQDVNYANPDNGLSPEIYIEAKEAPPVESTVTCEPEAKSDAEVNKEQVSEPVNKAFSSITPRELPVLSLPNTPVEDIWNDVPYSPGLEASANILFHMSRACSLFYEGNSQESEKGTTSSNSARRTVNISKPRALGVQEIVKSSRDSSASETDEIHTRKHQIRDGKQRGVLSHVRNSHSHSPDRSEQQNKSSHSSKSQNKPSVHKESRLNNSVVLKKPSVISSPSHSSLDRDNQASKVKKNLPAEATKLLRESAKRDSIPYHVKSRNTNGCSIKPSRHVLPYVEEVKVVATGLK